MLLTCLMAGCRGEPGPAGNETAAAPIEVRFSPHGGCTEAIVAAIDEATSSVLVQAYSFTSSPIANALAVAHRRGVRVEVIVDEGQTAEMYFEADYLRKAGVAVLVDGQHMHAHNKLMIIDDRVVISGSFNFTRMAEEHNAENLLLVRSPALAQQYTANWKTHAAHSVPYQGHASLSKHHNQGP